MRNLITVIKALADENRLRIVMALRGGELCVCQIVELLKLAPSTVSKHMSILKQAQLVDSRKEGRWMFYRLVQGNAAREAKQMLSLVVRVLATDSHIHQDAEKLRTILKMDRDELCRRQN